MEVIFKGLYIVSVTIFTIFAWTICFLIRGYIIKKPLGMQTLLDKFILNYLIVFFSAYTILGFSLYFVAWPVPLDEKKALIIYFSYIFLALTNEVWLSVTMIVKYISVFHSMLLDFNISDDRVMKNARIILLPLTL